MSYQYQSQGLYDPSSSPVTPPPDHRHPHLDGDTEAGPSSYTFSAIPLSPGLPTHPIAPDARAYLPSRMANGQSNSRPSPLGKFRRRSSTSISRHHRDPSGPSSPGLSEKRSILDELLPIPSSSGGRPYRRGGATGFDSRSGSGEGDAGFDRILRRTGSVTIIFVFILVASWLAVTDSGGKVLGEGTRGLRLVFGSAGGSQGGWVVQESQLGGGEAGGGSVEEEMKKPGKQPDFDQYIMLRTIPSNLVELSGHGRRVIFIGDVHGSYEPLRKLMAKLSYSPGSDTLIHVGDLVAKGSRHVDTLAWFADNKVLGVRGNHDQPVVQWRAWMEWAGGGGGAGVAWEGLVAELEETHEREGEEGVRKKVESMGKSWPKGWEWKGEHWHIAKNISSAQYDYLLQLPLTLHIPSIHSIVVHAGLLPSNPLRDPDHPSQPLISADRAYTDASADHSRIRNSEEISIIVDIPQNTDPWDLINMRGLYEKGKKKGEVTKSSKKGTPWSEVWAREMKRCRGPGAFRRAEDYAWGASAGRRSNSGDKEDRGATIRQGQAESPSRDEAFPDATEPSAEEEAYMNEWGKEMEAEGADEADLKKLKCSPVTVIYGHAAARGLDIKPFSKGLDTGCVYGEQLTALVLGELSGLHGQSVRLGEHRGVLVSVPCEKGGL